MRAILLLAVLLLAHSANGSLSFMQKERALLASRSVRAPMAACPTFQCVTTGQRCGSLSNTSIVVGSCTSDNTYCDDTTDVCEATKTNGMNCTLATECRSEYCDTNGMCADLMVKKQWGETCSSNSDCYSNVCTSTKCAYIAIGSSCPNIYTECEKAGYCDYTSQTCMAAKALGDSCTAGQCGIHDCIPTSESGDWKCMKAYSVGNGSWCGDSSHCMDGHACDGMGTNPGMCLAFPTSSMASCDVVGGTPCDSEWEMCECSYRTGMEHCVARAGNNPSGLQSKYNMWSDCLMSKCSPNFTPDCVEDNCKKQTCDVYDIIVQSGLDHTLAQFPTCFQDHLREQARSAYPFSCSGGNSGGSSSSASRVLMGNVALLLLFLFVAVVALF